MSFQRNLKLYLRAPRDLRTEAADLGALRGAGEEEGPPEKATGQQPCSLSSTETASSHLHNFLQYT